MAYEVTGVDTQKIGGEVFGLSLRELVKPVVGFRILTDSQRVRTQHLFQATTKDTATTGEFLFQLVKGEYVMCVRCATEGGWLRGIRFETNLRTSQWFGQQIAMDTVATVRAGAAQAIHSLCGGTRGVLGAVLWPIDAIIGASEAAKRGDCACEKRVVYSLSSDGRSFGKDVDHVAAIVVTVGPVVMSGATFAKAAFKTSVHGLSVLSPSEYARYVALVDVVKLGLNDHMIELIQGEQLTKVECVCDEGALRSIRFTTTRRVTPWFGSTPSAFLTPASVEAPPGAHIRRLFGRQTSSQVATLSVEIARPIGLGEQEPVGSSRVLQPGEATRTETLMEADATSQAWELMDA